MADAMLHIFAVNAEIEGRHTYLSRSKNETSKLPDLAGWLSLRQGGLDTDNIELFPLDDLGDLKLADYVATAFDLSKQPPKKATAKLNALDGHVLLIPDAALAGRVAPKSELTLIASLPMAQADHSAKVLETEASTYGQPSQDHVGWHVKKSNNKRIVAVAVMVFVVLVSVILMLAGTT